MRWYGGRSDGGRRVSGWAGHGGRNVGWSNWYNVSNKQLLISRVRAKRDTWAKWAKWATWAKCTSDWW